MLETLEARPWLLLGLLPAAMTLGCYLAVRFVPALRLSSYRRVFFIGPPVLGAALVLALVVTQPPDQNNPGIPDHILILGFGGYTTIFGWVLLLLVNFRHLISVRDRSPGNSRCGAT